ncbi:MAG: hypothetical protein H7Y02_11100 [Candidatus Obscuribacterales bacterium]|nr:hypothetical protein [Steroidobacteraceae bacterium]
MSSRVSLKLLCASFVLGLIAVPALAHHGWNGNGAEQFELTGTVETPVSLAGPHATMKIRVADQLWDITLAPPARTERAGLKEATIPVGAQVTVSGHRNSDTKRFEMKTERVTYNGKTYNVYPDRE